MGAILQLDRIGANRRTATRWDGRTGLTYKVAERPALLRQVLLVGKRPFGRPSHIIIGRQCC